MLVAARVKHEEHRPRRGEQEDDRAAPHSRQSASRSKARFRSRASVSSTDKVSSLRSTLMGSSGDCLDDTADVARCTALNSHILQS